MVVRMAMRWCTTEEGCDLTFADWRVRTDFAKRGLLKPIYTVYPLSKFDEAVQKLRRGEIAGRAVVDFNTE
jgi:D-arabinose 1-dehydrogenase-like Zn-dependent alcohol dehydrogenase